MNRCYHVRALVAARVTVAVLAAGAVVMAVAVFFSAHAFLSLTAGNAVGVRVSPVPPSSASFCADLSRWAPRERCPARLTAKAKEFVASRSNAKTLGGSNMTTTFPQGYFSEDFAIALIALCFVTHNLVVDRAIRSLRLRGQYCGPVILVHDRSDGRYEDLARRDGNVMLFEVPFSMHQGPGEDSVTVQMRAKRFKTLLFDLIVESKEPALEGVDHLLFIDADVVAGEPLGPFIEHVRERLTETWAENPTDGRHGPRPSRMVMFHEKGSGSPELRAEKQKEGGERRAIYHGGVIGMHRTRSTFCLSAWRDLFDSGRFHRDQTALLDLLYDNPATREKCEVLPLDGRSFFQMPTPTTMEMGNTSSLIHVTGMRYEWTPANIQEEFFRCILMLDEDLVEPVEALRPPDNHTHFYNYYWKDLPDNAKIAAALLGFDNVSWDADESIAIYNTPWPNLNETQQAAISLLEMKSYFKGVDK